MGVGYPHYAHVCICLYIYICVNIIMFMCGGPQGYLVAGVGLVTTFCPSVPFLPARPDAPWRRKKRRLINLDSVPSEQQGRAHPPFQTYLPTVRSKFTLVWEESKVLVEVPSVTDTAGFGVQTKTLSPNRGQN